MRALGDEPLPLTIASRMLHPLALQRIAGTLARGEPDDAVPAAVQRLLEDEAGPPLFLLGDRHPRGPVDPRNLGQRDPGGPTYAGGKGVLGAACQATC